MATGPLPGHPGVDCAYYSQRLVGMGTMGARPTQERRGTIVVDVSDPAHPKFATNLFTLGMMDPWESLKVNQSRGLLVAVNVMDGQGVAFMGVYDIRDDCRHPKKRYDGPITVPSSASPTRRSSWSARWSGPTGRADSTPFPSSRVASRTSSTSTRPATGGPASSTSVTRPSRGLSPR